MRIHKILFAMMFMSCTASCVQKSSEKTVVVNLNTAGIKNIASVGLRGEGTPLSWNSDLELLPVVKDSLYSATFTLVTGYKFLEAKFTINGQYELENQPNRRIDFGVGDTTFYNATFNQVRQ